MKNKKKLLLDFNQLQALLSAEAFEKYTYTHYAIYVVFTDTGSYFEVNNWLYNDCVVMICSTLPKLNEYFIKAVI